MAATKKLPEGVLEKHTKRCGSRNVGGRCNCRTTYQAAAWSPREKKRVYKTFPSPAAAKAWRRDTVQALERGELKAARPPTLREAADEYVAGMRSGAIRASSGDRYKPSVIRGYDNALKKRIVPALGDRRLSEIDRGDLMKLAEGMLGEGLDPSTIRNALMPLRALYRRALDLGQVAVNPTMRLRLPRVTGRRDRIASPQEAAALLAALADEDRALWATAFYAGLRLGELRALRWSDVDLERRVISIERSWDPHEGVIEPKSERGTRTVPVAAVLRALLLEHRLRQGRAGQGLVFGRTAEKPFAPRPIRFRAYEAWETAGLEKITLHEGRHTAASLMIAAGFNVKALSSYVGHSSVVMTFDRYGHLMPDHELGAADLLDDYLGEPVKGLTESVNR